MRSPLGDLTVGLEPGFIFLDAIRESIVAVFNGVELMPEMDLDAISAVNRTG